MEEEGRGGDVGERKKRGGGGCRWVEEEGRRGV